MIEKLKYGIKQDFFQNMYSLPSSDRKYEKQKCGKFDKYNYERMMVLLNLEKKYLELLTSNEKCK